MLKALLMVLVERVEVQVIEVYHMIGVSDTIELYIALFKILF